MFSAPHLRAPHGQFSDRRIEAQTRRVPALFPRVYRPVVPRSGYGLGAVVVRFLGIYWRGPLLLHSHAGTQDVGSPMEERTCPKGVGTGRALGAPTTGGNTRKTQG